MATFRERLIEIMRMRDITAAELARITGLSKPQISMWVNGKVEARQKALGKLGRALNVSESWLMGNDVPMVRVTHEPTLEDKMRVALFGGDVEVTDEMWEEVRRFAEYVKDKHEKEKYGKK